MSRIRSVHPGLFTDEAIMLASPIARFFLIGLWCEADDNGVFEWKPVVLRARILPADAVDGSKLLDELAALGVIMRFQIGDRALGAVKNFVKYQRPKSPKLQWEDLPAEVAEFVKIGEREEDPKLTFRRELHERQDGKCARCGVGITYYMKKSASLELAEKRETDRFAPADAEVGETVAVCKACRKEKVAPYSHGENGQSQVRKQNSQMRNGATEVAKSTFAKQRKEEGGRRKEEEASSMAPPSRVAGTSAATGPPAEPAARLDVPIAETPTAKLRTGIAAAFLAAKAPIPPDTSRAGVWVARGLDPALCLAVIGDLLSRSRTAVNKRLAWFEPAIDEAHAKRTKPPPEPASAQAGWERMLVAWKRGEWHPQWGAEPLQPGCVIPSAFASAWLERRAAA